MNSEQFLARYQEGWRQLSNTLDRMDKGGLTGLSEGELSNLGTLFRRVTANLAYAQANYPNHDIVEYLNQLVARAHSHIHKQETMGLYQVSHFLRRGFPTLLREYGRYIAMAAAILCSGMMVGFALHFLQPLMDGWIIPEGLQNALNEGLKQGKVGSEWPVHQRPLISTQIMLNNILVGLQSFAYSFTWGVGTVLILFYNGLMVGVLAGIFASGNYSLEFWSLILPHGIIELMAIFICGGAGLLLAQALVKPGDYTRRDALVLNGKPAMLLILGTIPMFVIAALIEGFITPTNLSAFGKLAFAALTFLVLIVYYHVGSQKAE